jgi:phosphoadenosine phosphosulfate reductase
MKQLTKYIHRGLFDEVFEHEAIENIRKFVRIAKAENLIVELGFSGGKDSIVCYSLCKRAGIPFIPVFNYAFESPEVIAFIRKNYPDVIIREKEKSYFQLIREKKFLPTKEKRYCCTYFKENGTSAIILGVRRQESAGRKKRNLFGVKSKRNQKKYIDVFHENCTELGKGNPIELRPILYWSEAEVWQYIKKNDLPYPALYDEGRRRCGCMLCPLATLKGNMYYIKKYPNLLPSFVRNVAEKLSGIDFIHKSTKENMLNNPSKYVLYWLSASFRPSKKDRQLIDEYLKNHAKMRQL